MPIYQPGDRVFVQHYPEVPHRVVGTVRDVAPGRAAFLVEMDDLFGDRRPASDRTRWLPARWVYPLEPLGDTVDCLGSGVRAAVLSRC